MTKGKRATRLGRAVEVPPSSPGKVSGFQDFKSLDVGARGTEHDGEGFKELYVLYNFRVDGPLEHLSSIYPTNLLSALLHTRPVHPRCRESKWLA